MASVRLSYAAKPHNEGLDIPVGLEISAVTGEQPKLAANDRFIVFLSFMRSGMIDKQ